MRHFIHLGSSKSVPIHSILQMMHSQKPHQMIGQGFAGVHKKDVGSMKSISGSGVKSRKLVPLRFKL
jgi:hypothetical protein